MDYNKNEIEFTTVSGFYTPEPVCFVHVWNCSNSVGEVVHTLRDAWKQFKSKNQLLPNAKGMIKEPTFKPSAIMARVQAFRKKGAYMRELPKGFSGRYNWSEIISASMKYKTNESRFRF